MDMDEHKKELFKAFPNMDELLNLLKDRGQTEGFSRSQVKYASRQVLDSWRRQLQTSGAAGSAESALPGSLTEAATEVARFLERLRTPSLKRVVNATGIILHTNLGRAPLCDEAVARVTEVARGYSNLEYDLGKGARGERYDHVRDLLRVLTGAEDALVVNNNAAAVLLVLNSLAEGREVIVSRGELIEIGGAFRIPEIMAKSGARLREVGTTNRTRLSDYERAISPDTALILKVHTSNYRIVGFSEETPLDKLVALGKKHRLAVISDLGSGLLVDLTPYGLDHEPAIEEVMATGVNLATFSGDKLLGGPQAGIIIGKAELLDPIKRNPLTRALRIDKLTLAALEGTLIHYLNPPAALEKIRVLKALTEPFAQVRKRAGRLLRLLKTAGIAEGMTISRQAGFGMAGGGSLPLEEIPTMLLAIDPHEMSPETLDRRLRQRGVVGRISADRLLLDCRTINDEELFLVRDALVEISLEADNRYDHR